jgi:hypothetical protein
VLPLYEQMTVKKAEWLNFFRQPSGVIVVIFLYLVVAFIVQTKHGAENTRRLRQDHINVIALREAAQLFAEAHGATPPSEINELGKFYIIKEDDHGVPSEAFDALAHKYELRSTKDVLDPWIAAVGTNAANSYYAATRDGQIVRSPWRPRQPD